MSDPAGTHTSESGGASSRERRHTEPRPSDPRERVLHAFVKEGRLSTIPASHSKRLVILAWLAERFDPGREYPEATVNDMLREHHPDVAALRRYLVDDGFLRRDHGIYWRSTES